MMTDPRYAAAVASRLPTSASSVDVYEAVVLHEVGPSADLLGRTYQSTGGADGFAGMQLAPHLAHDTEAMVSQARRLWERVSRPNAIIQIPGTPAGLAAAREIIATGINVNITLLFSPERYRAAAEAYIEALEARCGSGREISQVASVASLCVARIDGYVDTLLDQLAGAGQPAARVLRGKSAIACACQAYEIYESLISSARWQALASKGARPQRLAWVTVESDDASSPLPATQSTPRLGASSVRYMEELIVPDTLCVVGLETLDLYRRVGRPELRLEQHIAGASDAREGLERLGVDLEVVAAELERRALEQRRAPFACLEAWLERSH
jgi:transaldolase